MDSEAVHDLFQRTLHGGYDDDDPWEAVRALHRIGSREVFELAAEWCHSKNPLQRARGAEVLAQLGRTAEHPSNRFPEESYIAVAKMLARETEVQPLSAAITALGHLDNPAAIPLIIAYQNHTDPGVRHAVAFALGSFPNEAASIHALLKLMEDGEAEVRDWATFALGVLGDSDSAEIRDALFLRINDSNADVREEAMAGLGKRSDPRLIPILLTALESESLNERVIEAAAAMLGLEEPRKSWSAQDYSARLRACL